MSNSYFRFKQFVIHQDRCAMKVSTDSCIMGAWFAARIHQHNTMLDVGSGTGLLMMMLAQKSDAAIQGIEIDLSCFTQLQENVRQSKWQERLTTFHGDARNFSFPVKYDFIISNPPFYENDLPSPVEEDSLARHSSKLSLRELIQVIDENLSGQGSFGILLPYSRLDYFTRLCKERCFSLCETILIRHSALHQFSRCILHYNRRAEGSISNTELCIRSNNGLSYSEEFTDLLKDYYLDL